jgi:hypothetical protein
MNPQTVYQGEFSSLASISGTPGQQIRDFPDQKQRLLYDPAKQTTTHIVFNTDGTPKEQHVYDEPSALTIIQDLADLAARIADLMTSILFVGPFNQVEQDYLQKITFDRYFDSTTDEVKRIDMYRGVLLPSLADPNDLKETTYIVSATQQIVIDYFPNNDTGEFGETRRLTLDTADPPAITLIESFNGIPDAAAFPADPLLPPSLTALTKVSEIVPISDIKQLVRVFVEFNPDDFFDVVGEVVTKTEVLTFDAAPPTGTGTLQERRVYDGIHLAALPTATQDKPVSKDVNGKLTSIVLFASLMFNDPAEMRPVIFVKDFVNKETSVIWFDSNAFACVERQDIYAKVNDTDVTSLSLTGLGTADELAGNCA